MLGRARDTLQGCQRTHTAEQCPLPSVLARPHAHYEHTLCAAVARSSQVWGRVTLRDAAVPVTGVGPPHAGPAVFACWYMFKTRRLQRVPEAVAWFCDSAALVLNEVCC
jgi:hypothetical protein